MLGLWVVYCRSEHSGLVLRLAPRGIDISQLPQETYFVSIHLERGSLVKRIIKNE